MTIATPVPKLRRGPQPRRRTRQYVEPPTILRSYRSSPTIPSGAETEWSRAVEVANDPERRGKDLVSTLRCATCGSMLGSVLDLDGARVLVAITGRVHDRLRLIGVTHRVPLERLQALRLASQAMTSLTCRQGHERSLRQFLLFPVDAANRSTVKL